MGLKRILVGSVLGAVLFAGGVAVGQIDPQRHPNLSAAHDFIGQAIQKIDAGQAASKERLGGHGERAKELLHQADQELMRRLCTRITVTSDRWTEALKDAPVSISREACDLSYEESASS